MPPTTTTVHYDFDDISMLKTQFKCNVACGGYQEGPGIDKQPLFNVGSLQVVFACRQRQVCKELRRRPEKRGAEADRAAQQGAEADAREAA